MNSQEIELVNELALAATQEEMDHLGIKLSLNFLTEAEALQIEETRGKVLDWIDWFTNQHKNLKNKFTLSVSSKGRPPVTIGAAVFSYDIEEQVVNIHMVEHFKGIVFDDPLTKRMAFVALNVAFIFARTAKASLIRVVDPLPHSVAYYEYLSFDLIGNNLMQSSLQSIQATLTRIRALEGQHDYE
ncbi:TPA: hypothetical protein ACSTJZ_000728 [Serratia fonticola]|jgi:hypothetical protein